MNPLKVGDKMSVYASMVCFIYFFVLFFFFWFSVSTAFIIL